MTECIDCGKTFADDDVLFGLCRSCSEKDESCQTCKYRTGTRCNQLEEYTDDEDWCSAYKQKKETK
jgi:hypothetical protein